MEQNEDNDPKPIKRLRAQVNDTRKLMEETVIGQQAAITAIVTALGQCVDKEKLAEQLRLQVISYPKEGRSESRANQIRDALVQAAWTAIRAPVPSE